MKKEYICPTAIKYEFIEECGVLGENSGIINPDETPAKENNFIWEDDEWDSNDLWAEKDIWGDQE